MKRINIAAACFVFAAIFAVSAFAQTPVQSAGSGKMVVINTAAFDGKDGITRYQNAMNSLETEFKPVETKIQGMVTRFNTLGVEIKKIQDQVNAPGGVPIDQKSAETKVEEYQTLEKGIKREQEDAKAKFERRQQQVMGPLLQEIGKAMQDYATSKGYDLILDAAKLDSAGLILAFNPAKVDVTKDFIVFFNARPATAATAVTPK
ncbi:MAG TPA: OmpH family outer membrane protein [Pyrinomonadaceae bacterium]|nr:OmpH family outer membrane protein [Pyrinomonadaceae bacterium]